MLRSATVALLLLACAGEPSSAPASSSDVEAEAEAPAPSLSIMDRLFLTRLPGQMVRPRNRRERPETVDGVDRRIQLEVEPAAHLEAWVFEPERPKPEGAADTVLLLHGLGDSKTSMAGLARRLSGRGMRAVAVDLRGHGRSTGEHIAYGAFETADLGRILDALDDPGRVGIYAASYGAHIAVQLAGRDPRVDRVVAVGTYRSLRATTPEFVRLRYPERGPIAEAAIQDTVTEAGRQGGFDPDEASAERWIAGGEARVLLIHGEDDEVVPIAHAERLVEACANPRCQLLRLVGKDHLGSMHGPVLRTALLAWLEGRWAELDTLREDARQP